MKKRGQSGMTLVEVVVALLLFSLTVTPLFAAFGYGAKLNRRALAQTVATYAAQMKLEEACSIDFSESPERFNQDGEMDIDGLIMKYTVEARKFGDSGLFIVFVTVKNEPTGIIVTIESLF